MQVACSPHADNCDETISTLRCADARSERIVHWADHRHAHGCTKQPLKAVGIAKPSRSRPGSLTFDRFAQRAKQIKNAVKANVNRSNAELEKLVRADGFDRAEHSAAEALRDFVRGRSSFQVQSLTDEVERLKKGLGIGDSDETLRAELEERKLDHKVLKEQRILECSD